MRATVAGGSRSRSLASRRSNRLERLTDDALTSSTTSLHASKRGRTSTPRQGGEPESGERRPGESSGRARRGHGGPSLAARDRGEPRAHALSSPRAASGSPPLTTRPSRPLSPAPVGTTRPSPRGPRRGRARGPTRAPRGSPSSRATGGPSPPPPPPTPPPP